MIRWLCAWLKDRLIPDFLRAIDIGQVLSIRSPNATRPWQHVLEPLCGYLTLAEALFEGRDNAAEGWNFGPEEVDVRSVQWIVERLCAKFPGTKWECEAAPQPHEANSLKLDSSKAKSRLQWRPQWNLGQALDMTLAWHQAWRAGIDDMTQTSLRQIRAYEAGLV